MFEGKTLLITGGTGSFGNAVLKRFLHTNIKEIRIFSRDEKKQDDMRHELQSRHPELAEKVKFYIGVKGSSIQESEEQVKALGAATLEMVEKLI